MPQIGTFTRETTGFVGRIHTFTLFRELTIVPAEPSDAENAPDYRIHHGNDDGPEIGAAWKRTGERAGEFIAPEQVGAQRMRERGPRRRAHQRVIDRDRRSTV